MIEELQNLNASKTFIEWMTLLNGGISPGYIESERLINGFCEDLAVYLHVKYNVDIIYIGYFITSYPLNDSSAIPLNSSIGHYCVRHANGLYYDGWNVNGVTDVWDLRWSKNILASSLGYSPHCRMFSTASNDDWYLPYLPKLLEILKVEDTTTPEIVK